MHLVTRALLAAALGLRPAESGLRTGLRLLAGSDFEQFCKANPKVLVDFYADKDPGNWRVFDEELEKAVRSMRQSGVNVPVAKVDAGANPELGKQFVPEEDYPQLVWFEGGEPTRYHHKIRDPDQIANFVYILDREPVITIKSREEALAQFSKCLLMETRQGTALYGVAERLAKLFMDRVAVTMLEGDANTLRFIQEEKDPGVLYTGELTEKALEHWIREQLTPSEEGLPEIPEYGDAMPLVSRDWDEKVYDSGKDVFLMVYAPWCGYCRKASPAWEELARRTRNVEHLTVAKLDGTRNGSPYPEHVLWRSYPSMYFFRSNELKPVRYVGANRTVESFYAFLLEHSTRPEELRGVDVEAEEEL